MTKSRILKDKNAIKNIPKKSARLLKSIMKEIVAKQNRIFNDFCKKLSQGNYTDILVTIKVGNKYPKDVEGFPELLRAASQGKGKNGKSSSSSSLIGANCMICNKPASVDEHKQPKR
jgi:CRISPR-associated protein, Cas8b/Csh1 subtype I-B